MLVLFTVQYRRQVDRKGCGDDGYGRWDTYTETVYYLVGVAEDVGVVLSETAHARDSSERATQFVTMEHADVGHTYRQLAPRTRAILEHETVARTVHGLQAERFLLHLDLEHIVRVMLPMTAAFPQFAVEHVGRYHFLIVAFAILGLYNITYTSSMTWCIVTFVNAVCYVYNITYMSCYVYNITYTNKFDERVVNVRAARQEEA